MVISSKAIYVIEDFSIAVSRDCRPGTTFKRFCNSCYCGKSGAAACTKMACPPNMFNEDGSMNQPRGTVLVPMSVDNSVVGAGTLENKICEPGQLFEKECNTCICTAKGTAAICTLNTCRRQNQQYGRECQTSYSTLRNQHELRLPFNLFSHLLNTVANY